MINDSEHNGSMETLLFGLLLRDYNFFLTHRNPYHRRMHIECDEFHHTHTHTGMVTASAAEAATTATENHMVFDEATMRKAHVATLTVGEHFMI